ncbi:MAG: NAD-binding protein [Candidatus Methylomirabilales bacterium]
MASESHTFDTVVIGAGAIGVSVAYHLSHLGVRVHGITFAEIGDRWAARPCRR